MNTGTITIGNDSSTQETHNLTVTNTVTEALHFFYSAFSSFSISSMSVSVSAKNAVSEPETNAEQSRAAMAVRRATTLLAVGAWAIKSGSAQSVAHII